MTRKILTCVSDAGIYLSGWIYMWNIVDVDVRYILDSFTLGQIYAGSDAQPSTA